jgi:protein-S-isoprenylcysteine O-methyltransferase Ste14
MALQEEFETQGNVLFKYRSYIPLAFLLICLGFFYYEKINLLQPNLGSWYWYFAFAVGILGLLIRIYTVGHTPANTSGRNTDGGQLADQLNQTGIYSIVRHPLYLGNFLMWLAVVLLTANIWFTVSFILCYWLYYERIMYAEEAFLRKKFGEVYLKWAADKPAFVPKIKIPNTPLYPFSIKKVMAKEKNGVAALFLLFWIFELVSNFCEWGKFTLQYSFWFWGTVASGILYLILKVIKKYTKILVDEGR